MNLDEFTAEIMGRIKVFLPEEYQDAVIEVNDLNKLNSNYKAMTVRKEGQLVAPTIDMDALFRAYEDGEDLNSLASQAAAVALMQPEGLDCSQFLDYEKVKERLFIRVSNAELNSGVVGYAPHKQVEDLVITYHILASLGEDGMGSAMVTNSLLENFGVSQEQLHADAMVNSEKLLPPSIQGMEKTMGRLMGMNMEMDVPKTFAGQLEDVDFKTDMMLVLSNTQNVNGAAVMFYPDVLAQIGDRMQTNFFILPSSVHEVILVANDGSRSYKEFEAMVREINSNEVSPKDKLSDNVYHYDFQNRLLEKASDYENRMKKFVCILSPICARTSG